jgi:hypothetical protein
MLILNAYFNFLAFFSVLALPANVISIVFVSKHLLAVERQKI